MSWTAARVLGAIRPALLRCTFAALGVLPAGVAACAPAISTTAPTALPSQAAGTAWQFVSERPRATTPPVPDGPFAIVRFDQAAFKELLRGAPLESGPGGVSAGVVLSLPLPDRTFARVRVVESSILAPELAAAFPAIKTYVGQGVDDKTITVRLGWTQNGFHALLLGASGDIYIDPYTPGDLEYCITMRKAK
jgi:hypothetical protein